MDNRAATPVVGKALEAGIVVLYVALLTTAMYGTVVPGYRATAGEAVAERTVAAAAERVQQAVPPPATAAETRRRVALPETIAGDRYGIRVSGRTLVLEHPDGLGGSARLALPARVSSVSGAWESGDPAVVVVTSTDDGLAVRLEVGA